MTREVKDEGPKLREERNFEEFYDDLSKNTLIPIATSQNVAQNNEIDINERIKHENESNYNAKKEKVEVKQLIFNGKVTLEPIVLHRNRTDLKKTTISIDQLSTTNVPKKIVKSVKGRDNNTTVSQKLRLTYTNKFNDEYSIPNINSRMQRALSTIQMDKRFSVEYDMDEQDVLYVNHLNVTLTKGKLTNYIFETVISILEKLWYDLEKHIPPKSVSDDLSTYGNEPEAHSVHYQLYGSDDGTGTLEHACAVCSGGESTQSNAIVFCDGCDLAVHQECYGIVFIPEGQWLCRLCLVSKNRKVGCLFCPSTTGAFKQTDTGFWAHVVCSLWIPELYFANLNYMEPIEGLNNINKLRWKLNCYICDQKMGACIQCSNKNCFTAYHVTCAKRANLYMSFNNIPIINVAQNHMTNDSTIQSFCDKHSPMNWPDCKEGLIRTKRFFKNLSQNNISINYNKFDKVKLNKQNWKTNRGTPIAPQIFADTLNVFISNLKFENSNKLSLEFCKYWSMKRELRRGAPLVRRINSTAYNILSINQLEDRIAFADMLLGDLSQLGELASLVKKRVMLENEIEELDEKLRVSSKFPEQELLAKYFFTRFLSSHAIQILQRNLKTPTFIEFLNNCKEEHFRSIEQLSKEFKSVLKEIEEDMSTTRIVDSNANAARDLFNQLINEIKGKNSMKFIKQDFVIENDKIIRERPWRGPFLMEEEGLSEVEELSQKDQRVLKGILNI